jgi:hypothetical protein
MYSVIMSWTATWHNNVHAQAAINNGAAEADTDRVEFVPHERLFLDTRAFPNRGDYDTDPAGLRPADTWSTPSQPAALTWGCQCTWRNLAPSVSAPPTPSLCADLKFRLCGPALWRQTCVMWSYSVRGVRGHAVHRAECILRRNPLSAVPNVSDADRLQVPQAATLETKNTEAEPANVARAAAQAHCQRLRPI